MLDFITVLGLGTGFVFGFALATALEAAGLFIKAPLAAGLFIAVLLLGDFTLEGLLTSSPGEFASPAWGAAPSWAASDMAKSSKEWDDVTTESNDPFTGSLNQASLTIWTLSSNCWLWWISEEETATQLQPRSNDHKYSQVVYQMLTCDHPKGKY